MASTLKEARSDISTSRSSYSLVRTLLDGGARAHSRARGRGRLCVQVRVIHEVVISREIKKRENLVSTESSTIRKILYPRKFPAIR